MRKRWDVLYLQVHGIWDACLPRRYCNSSSIRWKPHLHDSLQIWRDILQASLRRCRDLREKIWWISASKIFKIYFCNDTMPYHTAPDQTGPHYHTMPWKPSIYVQYLTPCFETRPSTSPRLLQTFFELGRGQQAITYSARFNSTLAVNCSSAANQRCKNVSPRQYSSISQLDSAKLRWVDTVVQVWYGSKWSPRLPLYEWFKTKIWPLTHQKRSQISTAMTWPGPKTEPRTVLVQAHEGVSQRLLMGAICGVLCGSDQEKRRRNGYSTHLQDVAPKILCSCQIPSNAWLGSSIFLSILVKHPSRHQGAPWSGPHSTDQQWCARRPCSGWGFGDDMSCHVEKGLWQTGKNSDTPWLWQITRG